MLNGWRMTEDRPIFIFIIKPIQKSFDVLHKKKTIGKYTCQNIRRGGAARGVCVVCLSRYIHHAILLCRIKKESYYIIIFTDIEYQIQFKQLVSIGYASFSVHKRNFTAYDIVENLKYINIVLVSAIT